MQPVLPSTLEEAQAVIARQQQELAQLQGAHEAWMRAVAHDLRAPLRHVLSFAPLLRESVEELAAAAPQAADAVADAREFTTTMEQSARKMSAMLDGMAQVSHAALEVIETCGGMRPQCLSVGEQKVERAMRADAGGQFFECQGQLWDGWYAGVRFRQFLHDPAESMFAVGVSHGAEMRMQSRAKVFEVAVVGEDPVAAPKLTHKRVAILQTDHALGGLADMGDDVFAFDGITADQLCHG